MEAKTCYWQATDPSPVFLRVKNTLDKWNRNFLTRRELRRLEDHQLDDIGIDRLDAEREAGKPFWQD